jgi:dTDP-D-glucose 4,6-dehydratase
MGKPGEVYNIGGGAEIESAKLVESLCRIADELFSGVRTLPKAISRLSGGKGRAVLVIDPVRTRSTGSRQEVCNEFR